MRRALPAKGVARQRDPEVGSSLAHPRGPMRPEAEPGMDGCGADDLRAGPTEEGGGAVCSHVCLRPHVILKPWEAGSAACPERLNNVPRVTQSLWLVGFEYKPAGSKASWVLLYKLLRSD